MKTFSIILLVLAVAGVATYTYGTYQLGGWSGVAVQLVVGTPTIVMMALMVGYAWRFSSPFRRVTR